MGRWSQYDEDDYRLPEGFQRVGYDADTQIYTYQDGKGKMWQGEPGNRYGTLRPVGEEPRCFDPSYKTTDSPTQAPKTDFEDICGSPVEDDSDFFSKRMAEPIKTLRRSFTYAVSSVSSMAEDPRRRRQLSQPLQSSLALVRRFTTTQRDNPVSRRRKSTPGVPPEKWGPDLIHPAFTNEKDIDLEKKRELLRYSSDLSSDEEDENRDKKKDKEKELYVKIAEPTSREDITQ